MRAASLHDDFQHSWSPYITSASSLSVAFETEGRDFDGDAETLPDGQCVLIALANDVTYRRITAYAFACPTHALMHARAMGALVLAMQRQHPVAEMVFGARPPTRATTPTSISAPHLNESQRAAIEFALGSNELAVVHGPPGDGACCVCGDDARQAPARPRRWWS